jgi:hypothetical protein
MSGGSVVPTVIHVVGLALPSYRLLENRQFLMEVFGGRTDRRHRYEQEPLEKERGSGKYVYSCVIIVLLMLSFDMLDIIKMMSVCSMCSNHKMAEQIAG